MQMEKHAWPLGIVIALAIFMGLTTAFVRKAFSERVDLVATDYYYRDKEFSARLKKQNNLANKGNSEIAKARGGLKIDLPNFFSGKPISGKAYLYSPLNPAHDFNVPFKADGRSFQIAANLLPGQIWKVSLDFSSAGENYFLERNLLP